MSPPTFLSHLTLVLALLSTANASWRVPANRLVEARVDPVMNPGAISSVRPSPETLFTVAELHKSV